MQNDRKDSPATSAASILESPSSQLVNRLGGWLSETMKDPTIKKRASRSIDLTLNLDDAFNLEPLDDEALEAVNWPINRLMQAFFHLHTSVDCLRQCEYYFRRYPFRNREVDKTDHLRNMCEMYFAQFYVLRSRFKIALNRYNEIPTTPNIDVGQFLKQFDNAFNGSLRMRNRVNHHEPFDDDKLSKLRLTDLLSRGGKSEFSFLREEHDRTYRSVSREWATRAKKSAETAARFLDAYASAVMKHADEIGLPPR